jgi:tRNA pseudouridine32 synthase/23S rRNA pseudouridine746 synthase
VTEPARVHIPPTPGLDIALVHEEEAFVVVNKPAGMLSVPGRGEEKQDCARVRVQERYPHATGSLSCHRLDMDTSGLVVFALDPVTHRKLSGQFEKRSVRKWYVALLQGRLGGAPVPTEREHPDGRRGHIDLPLCVDWPNRPLQKVDPVQGRPGQTDWVLRGEEAWTTPDARVIDATRIELRPLTGRTHQLRVHCAHPAEKGGLGLPIIGDRLYGDETLAPRLLLHAEKLGFWHPYTGQWVKFEAPAPF